MKADLSLTERTRIDAEGQREVRAALVRRHSEVLEGEHAIEAAQMALDMRGPAFADLAARLRD